MMKDKPLLIAALIFGGIGLVIILTGCFSYTVQDMSFLQTLDSVFGLKEGSITPSALCQLGIVFTASGFFLSMRSLSDES